MRYVGLDVHKEFAQVTELCADQVNHYRVALDGAGLAELKGRLGPDTKVIMEASTGTFRLCDELALYTSAVFVANPSQTRGVSAHHVKTDVRDSEILARILQAGLVSAVWVADGETRSLRGLVQHRVHLGKLITKVKNQVRGLLADERISPPMRTLFSSRGLHWLCELELSAHSGVRLASLLRLHRSVRMEVERVDDALESWSRQREDAHLLITIPGVSWQMAAVILSQIGDVRRFSSAKKLCAYAGLVPRVHQSGKTTSIGSTTHSGRRILRLALFHVIYHAARRRGGVQAFYDRLATHRPKAIARVAAMRKLLVIMWRMLTLKQMYRDKDIELVARKLKARVRRTPDSAQTD